MERKKLIAVRTILITLTALVMAVIFILSVDNADESNQKSDLFADSFVYTVLSLFDLTDEEMQKVIDVSVFIVRKTAHFAEYCVLGFLLSAVFVSFYIKPKLNIPLSFASGVLYAVSDEIHQYFVPGRACMLRDVLIDSCGVACGIAALLFIVWLYNKTRARKKLKKQPEKSGIRKVS